MKTKSLFIYLPALLLLLSSCGGGGTSNNNPPTNNAPTKQYVIPATSQVNTPSSALTTFANVSNNSLNNSRNLSSNNNCFVILPQNNTNYSIVINSTQWWSSASINILVQNTCNSAQTITNDILVSNVLINGNPPQTNNISLSQSSTTSPTPPYLTLGSQISGNNITISLNSPDCEGQWCSWAQVPANGIYTIKLFGSYGGPINSLTLSSVSMQSGPTPTPTPTATPTVTPSPTPTPTITPTPTPTPTPPTPGILSVTVNTTQLQSLCTTTKCNILVSVISPAATTIGTISINPKTQPSITALYQNLLPGLYTVAVVNSSLPTPPAGASINYTYIPEAQVPVTSNTTTTSSVNFTYSAPVAHGNIQINLANVADAATFSNLGQINGLITDTQTSLTYPFQVTLNGSTTINNLPTAHTYTIQLQGIADPLTGVYYSTASTQTTLVNGQTNQVNFNYTQLTTGLSQTAFTVSGAPAGQKIYFGSDNSLNNYKYNVDNLQTANYTFANNTPVAITIYPTAGYTISTNPSPIIISGGSPASVTITYSAVANTGLVVGYLSNSYGIGSSVYTTVSQATAAGYNTIVIAFAVVNGTTPVTFYGDQFLAYTSWQTFSSCPQAQNTLIQDIQNAKSNGLKYALISVGGANNTFNLNGADLSVVAQNIVTFLNTYGLDGIDFDLEVVVDQTQLDQLIKNIRSLKPNVIITAAPQANSVDSTTTNVSLVTTGTNQNYNLAITNGDFSYLWLQAYNTGAVSNQINYNGTLYDETMVGYISASYYYFTGANGYITVPPSTKFLIGEPATLVAGGDATVWHNPNYTSNAMVYSGMASQYQALIGQSQFGGAMTWSINQDIDGGCLFSKAMTPVITGSSNITCPTNGNTYHGVINPNNC